jgi:DNA-binding transcriptional MocR family regulator
MVNIQPESFKMAAQTTQAEVSANLIDLAIGHPGLELLPLELLRETAARILGQGDRSFLQYGYEQGDARFRTELSRFLAREYGMEVSPESLFVSNGVSQALDLICSLFTRPGDRVFTEEPTYFLALRIFSDHGLAVEGLPTDELGLIPEALEQRLRRRRPVMLYTVPTHQNPTGATLPEARRERLVALCRQYGVLLVADEVYHLLTYAGVPPRPLAAHIGAGGVLSLGSFSKILAPGLRLGWVQGAPELLGRLSSCGFLDSGGGLAPFTSAMVRGVLEQGAQVEHLQRLRDAYGSRARAMAASLERSLGGRARFAEAVGGFFHWLRLERGQDSEELLTRARARGVTFTPGRRFSTCEGMRDCLRLSFSYYGERQIEKGIARLASAINEA